MAGRRVSITTAATLAGLGALAGIAMETNHGLPAQPTASAPGREIATGTSGAASVSTATAGAVEERAPIVTRASGSGPGATGAVDD